MAHNKRFTKNQEKVERQRKYTLDEALSVLHSFDGAKFDETVDISVRLGVDPKQSDQMVRGTVVLPNGVGKDVKVAVFAKGAKADEAKEAGADVVGADDLAEKIQGGWTDFDSAVATPDMMAVVGRLGKILGPRGLMPNPKLGTVTMDVKKAVSELKAGKVEFRTEKTGIVHSYVGKKSFSTEQLKDNINGLMEALLRAKPAAAKGTYLRSITLSTTMSPGVKVDTSAWVR